MPHQFSGDKERLLENKKFQVTGIQSETEAPGVFAVDGVSL